jgi:membrane-associated HD superfamily phosphohydrolase
VPNSVNLTQIKSQKLQQSQATTVQSGAFTSKNSINSTNLANVKHHMEQLREHNSKSALNSAKTSNNVMMGPQLQGAGNSMKRREKGRVIMQEWLNKSNNNHGGLTAQ